MLRGPGCIRTSKRLCYSRDDSQALRQDQLCHVDKRQKEMLI